MKSIFIKQIHGIELWTILTIELFLGMFSMFGYLYGGFGFGILCFVALSLMFWVMIFTTDSTDNFEML